MGLPYLLLESDGTSHCNAEPACLLETLIEVGWAEPAFPDQNPSCQEVGSRSGTPVRTS